jgi:hypothetical protein
MKLEYMSSEESMSEADDQDEDNTAGSGSDNEESFNKTPSAMEKSPSKPVHGKYGAKGEKEAVTMLLKRKIGEPSRRPRPTGGP